ncbi:hypothetical protein P3X46_021613 [Hevea brasiliensis]|uniref:Uncharacterized protein n=1 Tax=Hevea brasiliensis TaxID=3981 RepID=A0ABQ9LG46_HEVBR|nr:hypothetical protein P3X46_021613 [Hevea brasiliensis]
MTSKLLSIPSHSWHIKLWIFQAIIVSLLLLLRQLKPLHIRIVTQLMMKKYCRPSRRSQPSFCFGLCSGLLSLAWFAASANANAAVHSIKASSFGLKIASNGKQEAGPVEEFHWLGLMLFVAVPFPGTGAWTGATIASILNMPPWPSVSGNFSVLYWLGCR